MIKDIFKCFKDGFFELIRRFKIKLKKLKNEFVEYLIREESK